MIKNIISALFAIAACLSVQAQDVCVIKGRINNNALRYDDEMVYLTRLDEYDRLIKIDSAKVKKGKYSFKYRMEKDEHDALSYNRLRQW